MRTALLVLLLSVAGMGKGYAVIHYAVGNGPEIDSLLLQKEYAGFHDTIGDIEYYFASPHPAAPYKYPYNAAIVVGHADGTEATGPLVIPDSVHWFGNENSMFVPVARIDVGAFAYCTGLTSVTLPITVEEIHYGAFIGCTGMMGDLVIPNSVKTIGPRYYYNTGYDNDLYWFGAFEECGFTGGLTIGNSVDTIGHHTFFGCSGFTSVTSKATTPPYLGFDAFTGVLCTTLIVPCGCIAAYEASDWHNYFSTIIEDCTGLSEDDNNAIMVYPNPSNNWVRIEAEGIKHISISNMQGLMIYESKVNGSEFDFDFSQQETGVYFIRIESLEGVVVKKVVVTK